LTPGYRKSDEKVDLCFYSIQCRKMHYCGGRKHCPFLILLHLWFDGILVSFWGRQPKKGQSPESSIAIYLIFFFHNLVQD